MRCRDCGTTILDSLGQANGGFCKPCAKQRLQGPRAEEAPQSPPPPQLSMLQEGYRYVYNRTDKTYEPMFEGSPVTFAPHEVRALKSEVAEVLRNTSIITGTLRRMSGGQFKAERALALGPGWCVVSAEKTADDQWVLRYAEAEPEPEFLVPTTTVPGPELFDSESVPNYADRPSRENVPTKRTLIRV